MISRIVCYDPSPERGQLALAALRGVVGSRVQVQGATTPGEVLLALEESDESPESGGVLVALCSSQGTPSQQEADSLLAWFVSRKRPDVKIQLLVDRPAEIPSSASILLEGSSTSIAAKPTERMEFRDWAESLCLSYGIERSVSALPSEWWESRSWFVSSESGSLELAHGLEDEGLAQDLLAFLRLKARQLSQACGAGEWSKLSLTSEQQTLEVLLVEPEFAVLSMNAGDKRRLGRVTRRKLTDSGLLTK